MKYSIEQYLIQDATRTKTELINELKTVLQREEMTLALLRAVTEGNVPLDRVVVTDDGYQVLDPEPPDEPEPEPEQKPATRRRRSK